MAAWSRKTLNKISNFFCVFLWKNDRLRENFQNSVHRNRDRRIMFKFREIWPTEIGEIVRARKWIQYSAEAYLWAE